MNRKMLTCYNSLHANGVFCRLPMAFANGLNPDQDQQNIGLDQDPNCYTLIVAMADFFVRP